MIKLNAILILIIFLLGFFPEKAFSAGPSNTGYFVVTAYYSPLPDQKYYLKGNYKAELRLNGMGIRGASGKPVFSGMLAGPKTYAFGTKISLAGLGIGEISDRGGAIVSAGNRGYSHDRIDVWMGYGDEGLRRALYWGKRTVKGSIVASGIATTLNYKNVASPLWATAGLKQISNIFNEGIGINSAKNSILKLQEFFKDLNLYNGELTGVYNSEIMDIVYTFQLSNGIIKSENDYGAGYWGINTRNSFLKKYLNGDYSSDANITTSNSAVTTEEKQTKIITEEDIFTGPLDGEEGVKKLKEVLKEIGLYEGEVNGNYEDIKNLIIKYQIGKELIVNSESIGAGVFGPKTRATLKKDYDYFLEEQVRIEEEKVIMEQRKKELEEKFKELEKLATFKSEQKMSYIGTPKFGEISPAVRELQIVLKGLGYFNHKDTAIFGNITKQSLVSYQVDRGIITSNSSLGAGVCGPMTKATIKNDLKDDFLETALSEKQIDKTEISSLGIYTF